MARDWLQKEQKVYLGQRLAAKEHIYPGQRLAAKGTEGLPWPEIGCKRNRRSTLARDWLQKEHIYPGQRLAAKRNRRSTLARDWQQKEQKIFPGHARVNGNSQADGFASKADTITGLQTR